jgi:hypothetical protein
MVVNRNDYHMIDADRGFGVGFKILDQSSIDAKEVGLALPLRKRPRQHFGDGVVAIDAWPVIEGWLIAEPAVSANELMDRLATMVPDAYASKAQLRTLRRRVKARRAEHVKELVLGSLRNCTDTPTEV